MTSLVITVMAFAVINYALKAVGPVWLREREFSPAVRRLVDALPLALLCGMLVTSILGSRGSALDPALLAGLLAATIAWGMRAGHLVCVATCAAVTALFRLLG